MLFPLSPGTAAWRLFKNKKGKIPLFKRDLICDSATLMALPKSEASLDEFTTAFTPFIPLLTLNGLPWKARRKILSEGLRKINHEKVFDFNLPSKKGDIYPDIFQIFFRMGFELIFGRTATEEEFSEMYPSVADINHLIKRQSGFPDNKARWKLYDAMKGLIAKPDKGFIFGESESFKELSEVDQVSLIVEDMLTSICIQCTDLVCHLLLLYPKHKDVFKTDLDKSIDETLRLFPLTDLWTRKSTETERGWIASLMQLNRQGWEDPDAFKPERWNSLDHPPLISWGFDSRSCPATKIGYNLAKNVFQKCTSKDNLWIIPAANYDHDRTFSSGCQLWLGQGAKPHEQWTYKGKGKMLFKQWANSRLRVLDQRELW